MWDVEKPWLDRGGCRFRLDMEGEEENNSQVNISAVFSSVHSSPSSQSHDRGHKLPHKSHSASANKVSSSHIRLPNSEPTQSHQLVNLFQ
jgi:hypothetical protein